MAAIQYLWQSYMKTLHSGNYWSARRLEQNRDVIDNYDVDNYWLKTPEQTIGFMKEVNKPWIAYKVKNLLQGLKTKVTIKNSHNTLDITLIILYKFLN